MILGPNLIYQCPSCDSLFESSSVVSGHSFGAKRYSDGKVEGKMMTYPSNLFKCHGCQKFLWLSRLVSIVDYELGDQIPNKSESEGYPNVLSLDDFCEFLETVENLLVDDEIYVRMKVLWRFSDRIRRDLPQFDSINEKEVWNWNIVRLIELIDWAIAENRIYAAELMRYLKEWDFALVILNSIKDLHLQSFCSKVSSKCKDGNNLVFQF